MIKHTLAFPDELNQAALEWAAANIGEDKFVVEESGDFSFQNEEDLERFGAHILSLSLAQ